MIGVTHKLFNRALLVALLVLLSGCDSGGSDATEKGGQRWLEAAGVLNNFQMAARMKAVESRAGAADVECESIINAVRESIKNPDRSPSETQAIATPCTKAGLTFAGEVRCKSGRLQVLCQ